MRTPAPSPATNPSRPWENGRQAFVGSVLEVDIARISLKPRMCSGFTSELELARARTELASTRSEALALERRRAQLEHALAVLLGNVIQQQFGPSRNWPFGSAIAASAMCFVLAALWFHARAARRDREALLQ